MVRGAWFSARFCAFLLLSWSSLVFADVPTTDDMYLVSTPRVVGDAGCQQIVDDIAKLCKYDRTERWTNQRSVLWSSKAKRVAIANCIVFARNEGPYSVAFAAAYSGSAAQDAKCLLEEYRKRVAEELRQ